MGELGTTLDMYYANNHSVQHLSSPTAKNGDFFKGRQSEHGEVIKLFSLAVIIIATLFGNGFILHHVFIDRRRLSPTNILILSQCIADISTAILVMPFACVSVLYGWIFSRHMMFAIGFFNMFFTVVTLLHLGAIALDRYFAVVKLSHHHINQRSALWAISVFWTIAFVASFPWLPLLSDNVTMEFIPGFYTCGLQFRYPEGLLEICIFLLDCLLIIGCPLGVIIFSFYQIAQKIRLSRCRVSPLTLSNLQKLSVDAYAKSARTSFIVIFTSILQVFPACMTMALQGLQLIEIPHDVATVFKWIMWCHCFVKPLVYVVRRKYALSRRHRLAQTYQESLPTNKPSVLNTKRNYNSQEKTKCDPSIFMAKKHVDAQIKERNTKSIATPRERYFRPRMQLSIGESKDCCNDFDNILTITEL